MANANSKQVPYQHLAVLGMEKLKKYVPPTARPSPDDLMQRESSPANVVVDLHEAWEVEQWCRQWHVTREDLVAAVNEVGPVAEKIAQHLGKPYPR